MPSIFILKGWNNYFNRKIKKPLENISDYNDFIYYCNWSWIRMGGDGSNTILIYDLDGKFVNYVSLLPQEYKLLVNVKKQELQQGIERASLMAKDGNSNLIRLDVQEDTLIITSNSQLGKVREEVNINLQGDGIQIAFNSTYLLDVLKNMEQEDVVVEMTSSVSPCVIRSEKSNNYKYLVLPVRIMR